MSKGNPLLGHMRGKVGDLVFTRLAGEQVTRTRNAHPKNPQTTKQMAQRLQLETCVEFYKQGRENFFKFAFEGKSVGNSDYNAFVSANLGNVPPNTKQALNAGLPVVGRYIMTSGTLPSIEYYFDLGNKKAAMKVPGLTGAYAALTIGKLSAAIEDFYGLQDGDFLTFVGIRSDATPWTTIGSLENERALCGTLISTDKTEWTILQFKLDKESTTLVNTLGIFEDMSTGLDALVLAENINTGYEAPEFGAVAITASRDIVGGAKVSTSQLILNESSEQCIYAAMSSEWFEFCGNTFNEGGVAVENKDKAILEGKLSKNP